MPDHPETFRVDTHPIKALAAVCTVLAALLAGNAWLTGLVVRAEISASIKGHEAEQHGLESGSALNAARIATMERDVTSRIAELRAVQSGFNSDITWIKSAQQRQEQKLEELLRLTREAAK